MPDCGADPLRRTEAYRYDAPADRIATSPAEPADAARLMDLSGPTLRHRIFRDFPALLGPDDVLVINETRVIRARLRGTREPGGGAAQIVLLRPAAGGAFDENAREWHALVKPARRMRSGQRIQFGAGVTAVVTGVRADGSRTILFDSELSVPAILERHGELPLPPYVGDGDAQRAARYQTAFARVPGSVAAPTASLHFTQATLEAIRARGTTIAPLVLDVGLGTFKPMDGATIDEHRMHAERYAIPDATAHAVNDAKSEGRRVVVAGTTAMRALEASAAFGAGSVLAGESETALFITPGFQFRVADALLTNFHLPASTLLVLVTAFGGYDRVMAAYRTALAERYRLFSFGDAMFVTRHDLQAT